MSPFVTTAGKKNLQEGLRKMENKLTTATRVRREFLSGRPKKAPLVDEPLHPSVVWARANLALTTFRYRMASAGLETEDAWALIVYVTPQNPARPEFLALEGRGEDGKDRTPEEHRLEALTKLNQDGAIALGLVFMQNDREAGQIAYFPYQLVGLSEAGAAVLKAAGHLILAVNKMRANAH